MADRETDERIGERVGERIEVDRRRLGPLRPVGRPAKPADRD
jgi:hypothetical protein